MNIIKLIKGNKNKRRYWAYNFEMKKKENPLFIPTTSRQDTDGGYYIDKLLDFYVIRKGGCIKIYSLEKHQKRTRRSSCVTLDTLAGIRKHMCAFSVSPRDD